MAKIIEFTNVSYTYQPNTPFASQALKNISFSVEENKLTAIVGHTGSGKSTLLQMFNGLLLPDIDGKIDILDFQLTNQTKEKELTNLRSKVGLVFQFAESQLFAETVLDDVMFGPLNFGTSKEQAQQLAQKMLLKVGIDKDLFSRSPFELSGGQKRRVALAGVLAMQPQILILDEPTVGLDPKGRQDILQLFQQLKDEGLTLVMVTHNMDDVALLADQVILLEQGHLLRQTTPREFFADANYLYEHHVAVPKSLQFANQLAQEGIVPKDSLPLTVEELAQLIVLNKRRLS